MLIKDLHLCVLVTDYVEMQIEEDNEYESSKGLSKEKKLRSDGMRSKCSLNESTNSLDQAMN